MPKLIAAIPKYRKHRASGQAMVTLGGRDCYLGPHGTLASRQEYDRLVAEWLAAGRTASPGVPAESLTVVELIAAFLRYAKGYYGVGPFSTFAKMKHVLRPLRQLYGRSPAAQFGPTQFKTIRQQFVDNGHCRKYVNEEMRRIVQVFRWGAAEGLISVTVPQTLAMIPGLRRGRSDVRESPPVKPVDPGDVEKTLLHLSDVVAAMVRLQMLTGARPGEICGLRAGEIDQASEVWEARLAEHKTAHQGRERTLYLGPQAQKVLQPNGTVDPLAARSLS